MYGSFYAETYRQNNIATNNGIIDEIKCFDLVQQQHDGTTGHTTDVVQSHQDWTSAVAVLWCALAGSVQPNLLPPGTG